MDLMGNGNYQNLPGNLGGPKRPNLRDQEMDKSRKEDKNSQQANQTEKLPTKITN